MIPRQESQLAGAVLMIRQGFTATLAAANPISSRFGVRDTGEMTR
ncbi:MAG: hypothetical protein U5K38_03815 [Woeseiaceae bacterium]|nr:hypothetical protein [Woeseiaceae bacterium]